MMENRPPLTSPDGSSNRNTPERCPRPLYSRDYTQKGHKILRCYQNKKLKHIKNEVKQEAEEQHMRGDEPHKEEEGPPEISTDPGDSRDTQRDVKAKEEEEQQVHTKMKTVLEIGMDGHYRLQNVEEYPTTSSDSDDDITAFVSEENVVMPKHHPISLNLEKPFVCSECGKCYTRKHSLVVHQRIHTGEKPYMCSDCGKCFSDTSSLSEHKRSHAEKEFFLCSQCGRQFLTWRNLAMHQRVHSGENVYQCSKCGQSFLKVVYLKKHEKLHRSVKMS